MPEPQTTAERINLISARFNVPTAIIADAINADIICTVGYAGRIIIDAVDVILVVNAYKKELYS